MKVRESDRHWQVEVINDGPGLSGEMREQLFNSMVSVRDKGAEDIHLGLGLHIVQLIADFHGAEVDIRNREDQSGVCCSIALKKGGEH